ncbi:helix-turn-helix domain-containing protein [Haloarcula salina]|uniref:helix-turn-helix domain-containing protein n=1 Tax=Haloarcula salina TaxID=1429914 RepID=UPI003C6FB1E0
MATVAEFRLPTEAFVLGHLFERYPGAGVEIERVVPTGDTILPYIWLEGVDGDDAAAALDGTSGLEGVDVIDTVNGSSLLRCRYASENGGVEAIVAADVTLLSAVGDAKGWTVQVRGDSPTDISAFHRTCTDAGLDPTLVELHDLTETGGAPSLTESQREALVLADEMGYFDDERQVTLAEIASDLDISRQALSNRLRRGYRTLVRRHVR